MRGLLFLLLASTASMSTVAAVADDAASPREQARDERSFDPAIQPDGARSPTGEGVGTGPGTPSDMGPQNQMQVKGAGRGDAPGVGLQTKPTSPPAARQPGQQDGKNSGGTKGAR